MDLARDGREFARWTIKTSGVLVDPPQVRLLAPPVAPATVGVWTAWTATAWDGPATTDDRGRSVRRFRLLVAGPDAAGEGALVLALGTHLTRARVVDLPEQVPRDTEEITVG